MDHFRLFIDLADVECVEYSLLHSNQAIEHVWAQVQMVVVG